MSAQDYKFKGWVGLDKDCVEKGTLVEQEFTPKPFGDSDVDIKITHCGICGSDVHTLSSGWGATPYPICVGHEIVGHAVRVGKDVKEIKVGDRVGVGAQSCSCMKPDCSQCPNKNEQYCDKNVGTYGNFYPDGKLHTSNWIFQIIHKSVLMQLLFRIKIHGWIRRLRPCS